jgi:gamma-glutamyltranspeptidase/glutathione hydrolase
MRQFVAAVAAAFLAAGIGHAANEPAIYTAEPTHFPVYGRAGMVATQHHLASAVGASVLADGGNAADAAVAISFALAVTLPRAGNLGGGGFMLIYDAESGETVAVDYREMAPLLASRDMFLDAEGNPDSTLSLSSHLSAAVPGTVAGLHLVHAEHGRLPWQRLVQPAIDLARNGIVVTMNMSDSLKSAQAEMCEQEASCGYFYKPDGSAYEFGDRLVQSDLADTLTLIAEQGPDAFYRGAIAEKIIDEMAAGGGLVDRASLTAYRPAVREPLYGSYRGYEIVTMPAPSSGGVHILQMLNILEHFPVAGYGAGSADSTHLLAEVMRLAYADRSKHLGDPDFYPVPVKWLTGKDYAAQLAETIDLRNARPSAEVSPGRVPGAESPDTTHFSIMDADGNAVACTTTLNSSFGSKLAVTGAGFLLNNEMDDFVSKPGWPNVYGLLGGTANAIEPNKRPLSSMTPVMVFADGEPWFVTGSPGGSRIISAVLQMVVNVIDYGMNIAEATHRPRLHHQWYPDTLYLEHGYSPDTVRLLRERGHQVEMSEPWTSLQSVAIKEGVFRGASDPRRPDAASMAPSADAAGR